MYSTSVYVQCNLLDIIYTRGIRSSVGDIGVLKTCTQFVIKPMKPCTTLKQQNKKENLKRRREGKSVRRSVSRRRYFSGMFITKVKKRQRDRERASERERRG